MKEYKKDTLLMNPETGSVDTYENWSSDMRNWEAEEGQPTAQEQLASLVEVVSDGDGGYVGV